MFDKMNIESILEPFGKERAGHYDLSSFKKALSYVGNPEKNVYTLVIGGTNGKGTTTLLMSSALATRYRVATYLSPHLQDVRERFLLNLVPIDHQTLFDLAKELSPTGHQFHLSYFEFLTLIVFVWASRINVEFLVLEVGLGGLHDATNVTHPIACLLTNVALDHTQVLGNTVEEILEQKIAIVPKNGLLFSGVEEDSLKTNIATWCAARGATYYFSDELLVAELKKTPFSQVISLHGHSFELTNPSMGARKAAALSYLTLRMVFPQLSIPEIQLGFSRVKNPGRLEYIQESPSWFLSGDHNLHGLENLKQSLRTLIRDGILKTPSALHILCGFSPDKPWQKMVRSFESLLDCPISLLLVKPKRFFGETLEYEADSRYEPSLEIALKEIENRATQDDWILVSGSLYLVGEVRTARHLPIGFLDIPPRVLPSYDKGTDDPNGAKSRSSGQGQSPFGASLDEEHLSTESR